MSESRKPHPYRTAGTLLLFGGMIVACVWICTPETRAGVATIAVGALSSLGLWQARKSVLEHRTHAENEAEPPK
jgi:hypothetical protein